MLLMGMLLMVLKSCKPSCIRVERALKSRRPIPVDDEVPSAATAGKSKKQQRREKKQAKLKEKADAAAKSSSGKQPKAESADEPKQRRSKAAKRQARSHAEVQPDGHIADNTAFNSDAWGIYGIHETIVDGIQRVCARHAASCQIAHCARRSASRRPHPFSKLVSFRHCATERYVENNSLIFTHAF